MAEEEGPVGAVTLHLRLSKHHSLGQATVGRALTALDWAGFTKKHGNRGRRITPSGRHRLDELAHDLAREQDSKYLHQLLEVSSWDTLLEVLDMRSALEPHLARVAALRATPDAIGQMEAALTSQKAQILRGLTGAADDVLFHDLVAGASGNRVARHVLSVTRRQSDLSPWVAEMRRLSGGRLWTEHDAVLKAIKAKDAALAEQAMRVHIQGLITDLQRFRRSHQDSSRASEPDIPVVPGGTAQADSARGGSDGDRPISKGPAGLDWPGRV